MYAWSQYSSKEAIFLGILPAIGAKSIANNIWMGPGRFAPGRRSDPFLD